MPFTGKYIVHSIAASDAIKSNLTTFVAAPAINLYYNCLSWKNIIYVQENFLEKGYKFK